MNIKHTIEVFTENTPGMLYRITGLFLKRKINIESLTVSETENKGTSHFIITINETHETVQKVLKQLDRIIEVTKTALVENKPLEVSRATQALQASAIKQMQLLASKDANSITLAQGIPSFPTADIIKAAAIEAIKKNETDKYTSGYGIDVLRKAIVEKVKRDNNIDVEIENVMVTHGGIEALMATFLTLLNPEDEIIVLTPDYASHITQTKIALHGAKPICVPLKETKEGWVLEPEKIEEKITQNTKALLFCNPCNPTGKVYTQEELQQIANIALKHDIYIITDEIYEYFTFDNRKHISIGSFTEISDRVISIFGVSKSYCMTGWRIGYIVAPKKLIPEIFKIHDSLVTCPTAVSQYAALEAITGDQSMVREYKEAFEKRRDIVIKAIEKSHKLHLTIPQGAYYAFVKVLTPIDDYTFAMKLLEEAKVAVIPGSAFGSGGENHLRISFGGDEPKLKEGLERFVKYIEEKV
ncbi:MAG TPA: acetolactate synthase small subunit [Candidatus Saccharimonadales bacterium]|nr:acetolactate synthase small subunit [Candidatus Saccharimonadales bacterium]